MKTLKLMVIGILLFFAVSVQAQISVQVNLGTPPQWGPSGYTNVQYYYLPDAESYYAKGYRGQSQKNLWRTT